MPELPEVETVRRTLTPAVGRRLTSVWTSGLALRLGRPIDVAGLRRAVRGRTLAAIRRRGKYLLLDTDGPHSVLVHLGMSGRLRLVDRRAEAAPHTHVIVRTAADGDARELRYSDPRRFGMVEPVARAAEDEHPSLAVLGVDPLETEVDADWFHQRLRASKRTIKDLLLDQGILAGVGNIYASEALWQAGIRPTTRGHRISRARALALALAVREVLERALSKGGTSLKDFVDADGRKGENSHYLWVYDREADPCPRPGCNGTIERRTQGGRATFFCPRCQQR